MSNTNFTAELNKVRDCPVCSKPMVKTDVTIQNIPEPPQVWQKWKSGCGYSEEVRYSDNWIKDEVEVSLISESFSTT